MSLKLLVVSMSEAERLIIKDTLSDYNVLNASDDLDAIHQINMHTEIALIIVDLNIPNAWGFSLLDVLNSEDRYKRIRTIILTNPDTPDDETKGLKLGAVDYLRKPIQGEGLKARIMLHFELIEQQMHNVKEHENHLIYNAIYQQAPVGIATLCHHQRCQLETY